MEKKATQRILAIDYGKKRIGLALSDPSQTVAFPREVLPNKGIKAVLHRLRELIDIEEVGLLLVGWPINMKGELTDQTRETQAFIDTIQPELGLEIKTMDERLSTIQAAKYQGDDAMAAQILLQTYLDMIK